MQNRRGHARTEPQLPAPSAVFTVRYCRRSASGSVALLIDDGSESVYLFSGGRLQLRFTGEATEARLKRLLVEHPVWTSVPLVAPYTLEGLQQLAGRRCTPAHAHDEGPPHAASQLVHGADHTR